jgi:hypothetical protein
VRNTVVVASAPHYIQELLIIPLLVVELTILLESHLTSSKGKLAHHKSPSYDQTLLTDLSQFFSNFERFKML